MTPHAPDGSPSWVIFNSRTGEVLAETYSGYLADLAEDTPELGVLPAGQYLGLLNVAIKAAGGVQPPAGWLLGALR